MLSSYEIRVIALAANVDTRTLKRVLSGGRVQPAVYWRVARELRTRRLEHLLPDGLPLTLVAS